MTASKLQQKVISIVCEELGVNPKDLFTKNRKNIVSLARHVCIYILKIRSGLSYEDLGRVFHKDGTPMDHTSTRHSFITVQGWLHVKDESVYIPYVRIMEKLNYDISKEIGKPNKLVISYNPGFSIDKVINLLKTRFHSLEYEIATA